MKALEVDKYWIFRSFERLMISNLSLNHPLTWKNIILPSQQQLTSSSLACPFWIGKRGVFSFIPARHSIKVSDSNRFLSLFLLEPRLMINVGMPGRLEKRHHHTIFWWWFQCYQPSWFEICQREISSRMVYVFCAMKFILIEVKVVGNTDIVDFEN